MSTSTGRDTISIESSVHEIYKHLTESSGADGPAFQMMKDVFMWAVVLGYQSGERRPLEGKKVTIFRWAQLSQQVDIPLLKALAIAETNDVEILMDQDAILSIAEEYANRGIQKLSYSNDLVLDNNQFIEIILKG